MSKAHEHSDRMAVQFERIGIIQQSEVDHFLVELIFMVASSEVKTIFSRFASYLQNLPFLTKEERAAEEPNLLETAQMFREILWDIGVEEDGGLLSTEDIKLRVEVSKMLKLVEAFQAGRTGEENPVREINEAYEAGVADGNFST
jgi:hypothetical protein